MSSEELATASCAIYVGEHRKGTGTLVNDTSVLTAAHVVQPSGPVTIRFFDDILGAGILAERLPLGAEAEKLDIAVLKLAPDSHRPPRARLWPAARLPQRVKTFGYPVSERKAPRGVWRDSVVSGVARGDRVQLDWVDVGTLDGHSGGPVCDMSSGLMVGVLVEGSEVGHFDRFVSIHAIRHVWDGLPRPWLFGGVEARSHFTQRAAGQQSISRGGDLFRGRREALDAAGAWLRAERGPGIPLVITAQPGAGKSAVLARTVLNIEQSAQYDGVAFHSRDARVGDFVDAVSAACGLETPSSWKELVEELAERGARDVLAVAVDALDEAASEQDCMEIGKALCELARLEWLRVVIATRPLTAGDRYRPGSHLHRLGVRDAHSRNLVDLDTDNFFAADDLTAYAETLLAQQGFRGKGPVGGAWQHYQQDSEGRARLAKAVASRAKRNYLVAGMSAFGLAEDPRIYDPASPLFDWSAVPSGVYEALGKCLDRLPGLRHRYEALLTALAYARGPGIDDDRWLAFARVLDAEDVTTGDLAQLRASGAADYLIESSVNSGIPVTRLFHQALADVLIARRRDRARDETRLIQLLRAEGGNSDWLSSSLYARNYAPSHAAAGGQLEYLVGQTDFLASMAPAAMRSTITLLPTAGYQDPISIYDIAFQFLSDEPGTNAAILEFVSRTQGNLALSQQFSALGAWRPYKTFGNIRPFSRALVRFDGHKQAVGGVAVLSWPGLDHQVLVTASYDGTARVWDPLDPEHELARFEGHASEVVGVAVLSWPGLDHPVIVTASSDGTARVWDPLDDSRELACFERHDGTVSGVAGLSWPGLDHPVVVTTSSDGTARVWDPLDPVRELARFDGHAGEVMGVAVLSWPALRHPVVATTSSDGTARVWDPLDDSRELACFEGHDGTVLGVAVLSWPNLDHAVIVTTSSDRTARVWDPLGPVRELARFGGHISEVLGAAVVSWPGLGHQVIVTASYDGTARVWDPHGPVPELACFEGHTSFVLGAAVLKWPALDHPVIVTAANDKTAQVWDPLVSGMAVPHFNKRLTEVLGVAPLSWPGVNHSVVVTASYDGTARVWDPLDPVRELARFDGHTDGVVAAAVLSWPGLDHPVIVTASFDGTARVWDPLDPEHELARFDGHTDGVVAAAVLSWPGLDHPVIVTASYDGTARVWDPLDCSCELACFDSHASAVLGVSVVSWPGLDHPVIVTASYDGTARVWDPLDPVRELARFDAHTDGLVGVSVLSWPGLDHPVIVTTSYDGTARVWDPLDPVPELARFDGHTSTVMGAAALSWPGLDHQVIVTASFDGTAQIWDPRHPEGSLARLPLFGEGHSVAALNQDTIVVASSRGFIVFELNP